PEIYRDGASLGEYNRNGTPRRIPSPILAPESALGSRLRVALSSAQVIHDSTRQKIAVRSALRADRQKNFSTPIQAHLTDATLSGRGTAPATDHLSKYARLHFGVRIIAAALAAMFLHRGRVFQGSVAFLWCPQSLLVHRIELVRVPYRFGLPPSGPRLYHGRCPYYFGFRRIARPS